MTSAAAPDVGTSAAGPGKPVSGPNATAAATIAATPYHAAPAASGEASRPSGATASSPPRPSSHARAGVEK